MSEIDPALVGRMVTLVRELHADHVKNGSHDYVQDFVSRTAAIVAELPKPVDPDLIEARALAHAAHPMVTTTSFIDGKADTSSAVKYRLEGIKRGRELERGE